MQRKVAVTFILGLDCMVDLAEPLGRRPEVPAALVRELPAPIFALEAPDEARAGVPFSLNAWVGLTGPLYQHHEIVPGSFEARFDPAHQRIVVTGRVRKVPPTPGSRPRLQRALVVGIPVVAPAGMYALEIPESHYAPETGLPLEPDEVPAPRARQWLQVSAS